MRLIYLAAIARAFNSAANRKSCVASRPITSYIFVSTVTPGIDQGDFLAIKNVAMENSRNSAITGLLACNGFNFMQCIEGDRSVLNALMHRIWQDDRHSGVTIVDEREARTRQFAQLHVVGRFWSAQQGSERSVLSEILADKSVSNVARTMFQSFDSLGIKKAG